MSAGWGVVGREGVRERWVEEIKRYNLYLKGGALTKNVNSHA